MLMGVFTNCLHKKHALSMGQISGYFLGFLIKYSLCSNALYITASACPYGTSLYRSSPAIDRSHLKGGE